jgi:hypothetical protein
MPEHFGGDAGLHARRRVDPPVVELARAVRQLGCVRVLARRVQDVAEQLLLEMDFKKLQQLTAKMSCNEQ